MITVLRLGPFANNLCKKPTTNLDQLRQRAAKFMQMKELRDFHNQVRADGGVEKKYNERKGGQQYIRVKKGPRGQKFPHYTSLSTNRDRILQEEMIAEIILASRKARTPEQAYPSKHYQYHRNHGHHTKECITLKT